MHKNHYQSKLNEPTVNSGYKRTGIIMIIFIIINQKFRLIDDTLVW